MSGQLLLQLGLLCGSVTLFLAFVAGLSLRSHKQKLEQTLDKEYGPRRNTP